MDIGLKLKNHPTITRLEKAGNWNVMMTYKVNIISSKELDKELFNWSQKAYEQNGPKDKGSIIEDGYSIK